MDFLEQFKAARLVSTPLIAIACPDPAATIDKIAALEPDAPRISWDSVRGLSPLGGKNVSKILTEALGTVSPNSVSSLTVALEYAAKLAKDTILFLHQTHLYFGDKLELNPVKQAIWNLRDVFKGDGRTLVMLIASGTKLPYEIQDTLLLDEPLPDTTELEISVVRCFEDAKLPPPDTEVKRKAVEALSGLSAFTAEQVTMMSLSRKGLDLVSLWDRKKQSIEQTPGLAVWRGGETFNEIGGVANIKKFLLGILNGPKPPKTILYVDEIEKCLAGSGGGDLSGVSQELLGYLLSWMQDFSVAGILALGPPGCAKSMIAKATGAEVGIPTIAFDFSGMKASLVGQSGQNLRQALKVVNSVSGGEVLCIATCNSISSLPPELRRRFGFGTFFFDLPDKAEREVIWQIYLKKFSVTEDGGRPEDNGWTGAEIKQCCNLAFRLKLTLREAASYIVPISKSAAEIVESLRLQANGRFISASHPGLYDKEYIEVMNNSAPVVTRRKVNIS